MKLSDLIQARNSFNKINIVVLNETLSKIKQDLDVSMISLDATFLDNTKYINQDLDVVTSQLKDLAEKIKSLGTELNNNIDLMSEPYCIEGNIVDGIPNVGDASIENIRTSRHRMFSDETNHDIITSIRTNTNPKYPALEFVCGDGYWTKFMVAADPLYIVDYESEFLKTTSIQFPNAYQNRLRSYLFGHHGIPRDGFDILPQNQFGYILTVNNFEFVTLDRVQKTIEYFFKLLRPGGIAFFTYNNCEISLNAKFVESGFKAWATKTLLEDMCKSLGFDILKSTTNTEISWMEIKKPGELKTVKTHQALGEIVNRNN